MGKKVKKWQLQGCKTEQGYQKQKVKAAAGRKLAKQQNE